MLTKVKLILNQRRYNLSLDSEKEIVYDEEPLEFATKNSLLFFHNSSKEKNESGINQLFY